MTATSRGDYSEDAQRLGVTFYPDMNDLCEAHPDIVVLASSILSAKQVLHSIPVQRLRRSTLFVDVLSVKLFPKQLMLAELPGEVSRHCILNTCRKNVSETREGKTCRLGMLVLLGNRKICFF